MKFVIWGRIRIAAIVMSFSFVNETLLYLMSARSMPFHLFLAWSIPLMAFWWLAVMKTIYGSLHFHLWSIMQYLFAFLMVACALLTHLFF